MILYDKIQQKEREINTTDENIQYLEERGFKVNGGKLLVLKEEAEKLLNDKEYRDNTIVQRLKGSYKLQDIVDGIISSRKFSLKFRKEARKKYNEKVEELSHVISTYHFKESTIFNPFFCVVLGNLQREAKYIDGALGK